jgi:hypothetical protein
MIVNWKRLSIILVFLLTFSLIAACGSSEQSSVSLSETVTPTATMDPSGYQAVEPRSCLINEWSSLQAEQNSKDTSNWLLGDLLAWRPGGKAGENELAFLAPGDRSSWFTGTLTLARGAKLDEKILLAPGVLASGDLNWSPDGAWLAFLAYRPNEGLYTVMVSKGDGSQVIDLFPTDLARTDTRSSKKAIVGWQNNSTVQVIASCGEECRQAYDIDVTQSPAPVLTPTVLTDYTLLKKNLAISQYALTVTPASFPKNMVSAKWAPDERLAAYLDHRGLLWILSIDEKVNYTLDIGLRDVYELQWSSTSTDLAVRAEDRIFIFEIPCRTQSLTIILNWV